MSGKGSRPRPISVDKQTFDTNWDKIFNKNNNTEKNDHFMTKETLIKMLKDFPDDARIYISYGIEHDVGDCIVGTYFQDGKNHVLIEPL